MLSDKIKGKSALKARTFLHVVRDKVHACYWYRLSMHLSTENSAGYLQRVQIFLKPFIGEINWQNFCLKEASDPSEFFSNGH